MIIKTSDLAGPPLDWAVAKCEGMLDKWGICAPIGLKPSTDWAQGGPIIERENISIRQSFGGPCEGSFSRPVGWEALRHTYGGPINPTIYKGSTPLIAAMRCYIASKLGCEVNIPDELI